MPSPRFNCASGPINDREIVILGGKTGKVTNKKFSQCRDVVIFDIKNESVRVAIDDVGYGYQTDSQTALMMEKGVIVALMVTYEDPD
mmetsp:Transcript_33068/g.40955  ORF Transcript_33068/g.40955 Transcript_33068/m.40955 type:complete len:87 (-) Transcript_33068:46-306(-)|eukprot:CAMPEP_0170455824 /NCGR_PEP_ID=MMETSP0123-20130129/3657_1 /TAXON_ID=182087 /ORGANISM="Favella ehrenbergii, Strain Fehren 1" /LENGTH=86 /DNA_ID=CAMNT_0010719085 /DNA_START=988 /DNA_END=1248 /DNA_ORIENTATION=-